MTLIGFADDGLRYWRAIPGAPQGSAPANAAEFLRFAVRAAGDTAGNATGQLRLNSAR